MKAPSFQHVRHWVFDLDNTLYPPEARLFDQIEVRMTGWVARTLGVDRAEADRLRRHYWQTHGTTLAGLMAEHGADPDPYLVDVHEITLDHLSPDPLLARAIAALPGRRIVFTNGSAPYAARVLAARGLAESFHAVYGVENAGFTPKPQPAAFERIFAAAKVEPHAAAMFEDDPRNLMVPHAMGLTTVLVAPTQAEGDHIHHHTTDLAAFLSDLPA
ncbi:pyrimidine 5'-nucleotidase [Oceaniglobus roseus]|uniref:pyrimidine 5'-nucleotidase n=1 Tax=Oceaniglobus roseus TaxID=1737570 RepID=UPI000C7F357C|nr:pyrimidine 5'-nucleotidase [Kandeliimicrobium roseum]